jgi:hypothetical protein
VIKEGTRRNHGSLDESIGRVSQGRIGWSLAPFNNSVNLIVLENSITHSSSSYAVDGVLSISMNGLHSGDDSISANAGER